MISINAVFGENGIIERAEKSERMHETAQKEETWMDELSQQIDIIGSGNVEQVTDQNPGELDGEGTQENPYLIESIEDLIKFSQEVNNGNSFENKYVKLQQNLNFNADESYVNPNNTELFQDYNEDGTIKGIKEEVTEKDKRGFIPIGKEITGQNEEGIYVGNFFAGKFDGNNKVISNVYINREENDETIFTGFFGGNIGEIKKIAVTGNINVVGENIEKVIMTGGLVAYNGGKIENCYNIINIYQKLPETSRKILYTGGIIGYNYLGDISNCCNKGSIKTINIDINLGGIVGHVENGNITSCINKGEIVVERKNEKGWDYIGEIVGETVNEIKITDCHNSGNIYAESKYGGPELGGIVGWFSEGKIKNCYNTGDITTLCGWAYAAGIIGDSGEGTIINCYNTGNIKGIINYIDDNCWLGIGGVGACSCDLYFQNCYNTGDVIAEKTDTWSDIGGFASELCDCVVENCYNYGNVIIKDVLNYGSSYSSSTFTVGAFSGNASSTDISDEEIKNCYNFGNITLNSSCDEVILGGFIGEIYSGKEEIMGIKNCYTIGEINIQSDKNIVKGSFFGTVEGNETGTANIENCYYLNEIGTILGEDSENITITNSGKKTEEEMKSQEFIQTLNTNNETEIWKMDSKNQNKGFPMLYFQ